jgi:hypothetical protein
MYYTDREIAHRQTHFFKMCSKNLYRGYPKKHEFQNSEYEVHQVGPKDAGSRNYSLLTLKGEAVVAANQVFVTVAKDT